MEPSGRRKLFERLNQAKKELEEKSARESDDDRSSVGSATRPNAEFPRGAGRAKLFRPEVFERLSLNPSNDQEPSASTSSTTDSGISENVPSPQEIESPSKKIGSKGDKIPLMVNYIPIKCKSGVSRFMYEVQFEPNIHSNMIRCGVLTSILKPRMPVFTFDGTILYLPRQLPDNTTTFQGINQKDNNRLVEVKIIFKRKNTVKESAHFYNLLFKQVMRKLEYVQFGQKMFDPNQPKAIPHRQLTIWPGYVMTVDEYDDGLMLMLNTSHRVLLDTKVIDILRRIEMSCHQHQSQNFKDSAIKCLIGAVVLTPYNKKTYTIHDIDFDQSPLSKFQTKNGEISYVDYYKSSHGTDIHDLHQPLLIHYKERKMVAPNGRCEEDQLKVALIPELCQLTGLTDEMRSDKMMMRDIASYTRITPNQRLQAARQFITRVNETPSARMILDNWGLSLSDDLLTLDGRQLPSQEIKFGGNSIINGIAGDFNNKIGNNTLFEVVDLNNWLLFYTSSDSRTKDEFLAKVQQCAAPMGLTWQRPTEHMLPNDRTDTYANALRTVLRNDTQMAVFICPTSRDDRYSVIKKICCAENPIASQVINARTLANKEKNRSIVQKILMQMNCKLGGSLWTIKIPFGNVMICGTDTYHSPDKQKSVGAFVASLNATYTKWYSKATMQSNHEELMHGLTVSMKGALKAYKEQKGDYPDRIIFYRDGVGTGQFSLIREFEFPQIKQACCFVDEKYNPDIAFIVVQKRINTRLFMKSSRSNQLENAPPGTVLDHSITCRGLFDFYLVSQQMRHGTVTPTHYVVVVNEPDLSADILQQLSYKLTYQYFNWPGSIRVPAPCQYAHKLAYLVGESIRREPSEKLNDKLFYL